MFGKLISNLLICIFDKRTRLPSMGIIPLATSITQKLENSPAEKVRKKVLKRDHKNNLFDTTINCY